MWASSSASSCHGFLPKVIVGSLYPSDQSSWLRSRTGHTLRVVKKCVLGIMSLPIDLPQALLEVFVVETSSLLTSRKKKPERIFLASAYASGSPQVSAMAMRQSVPIFDAQLLQQKCRKSFTIDVYVFDMFNIVISGGKCAVTVRPC